MMTSLAFILGVVPLVLSQGAGAEMRKTLGTAVFSGMLGVTLFGIFLTPVFYYVIQWSATSAAERQDRTRLEDDSPLGRPQAGRGRQLGIRHGRRAGARTQARATARSTVPHGATVH